MTVMGLGLNPSPPGHSVLYSAVTHVNQSTLVPNSNTHTNHSSHTRFITGFDSNSRLMTVRLKSFVLLVWKLELQPSTMFYLLLFLFFFPHQPSQISQFSTEPSGLEVTSVTQSYKAKSFSSCHGGKHFLVSHSCSAEKHVFAIWSNL